MITFKNFLLEDEAIKIGDFLKTNCSNFCKEAKITISDDSITGELLYRGFSSLPSARIPQPIIYENRTKQAFLNEPRRNRQPLTTNLELHNQFDAYFKKNYGYKARSESVFCTGDFGTASSYGSCHAIFPLDNYEYIWSPVIEDLYFIVRELPPGDTGLEELHAILDTGDFKSSKLPQAISSGHEIMLKCGQYLAIPFPDGL